MLLSLDALVGLEYLPNGVIAVATRQLLLLGLDLCERGLELVWQGG